MKQGCIEYVPESSYQNVVEGASIKSDQVVDSQSKLVSNSIDEEQESKKSVANNVIKKSKPFTAKKMFGNFFGTLLAKNTMKSTTTTLSIADSPDQPNFTECNNSALVMEEVVSSTTSLFSISLVAEQEEKKNSANEVDFQTTNLQFGTGTVAPKHRVNFERMNDNKLLDDECGGLSLGRERSNAITAVNLSTLLLSSIAATQLSAEANPRENVSVTYAAESIHYPSVASSCVNTPADGELGESCAEEALRAEADTVNDEVVEVVGIAAKGLVTRGVMSASADEAAVEKVCSNVTADLVDSLECEGAASQSSGVCCQLGSPLSCSSTIPPGDIALADTVTSASATVFCEKHTSEDRGDDTLQSIALEAVVEELPHGAVGRVPLVPLGVRVLCAVLIMLAAVLCSRCGLCTIFPTSSEVA